ncbi:MAG: hypothetical protein HFJ01_05355 [Lachnospiraceae bacterium]|uniref:hypothetical protein n=1 Tax=Parablautia intestinalis TaxID=2320100 RepID=UPI0011C39ABE|nr:hypothetical protein [Parablautia intestinalis]MCI8614520.1 hypothetical protein [Lachnospiraceae bacterium]
MKGYWGIELSPQIVIGEESIDVLCNNNIKIDSSEGDSITLSGPPYVCSKIRYESLKRQYKELRNTLLKLLSEEKISAEDFKNLK